LLRDAVSDLWYLLFPWQCHGCGRRCDPPDPLCPVCWCALERHRIDPTPSPVGGVPVIAAFSYAFPLDRFIPQVKRGGLPTQLAWLSAEMARQVEHSGLQDYAEAVVPVPLHISTRRERGYDQAVTLAQGLATRHGAPLLSRAVRRRRRTPPQKYAGRAERARALEGAFVPGRDHPAVAGRRVLLVDDVVTTGATLSAARQALEAAGAAGVLAVAAARTPLRHKDGLTSEGGGLNLEV
jgi:ComF family protein